MKHYAQVGLLFMAAISSLLVAACQVATQKGSIKIAFVAPLTGDLAAMGQGMKNAAELALSEYRLQHPESQRIELAIFDDRADPKEAVNAANQIISDPAVVAVVGHLNSGCSIPSSAVYNRHNLLMISPASTNPKLTQQNFRNVFRTCTTDEAQGGFAADYLYQNAGLRKIAVIHDKTAYGQGLAEEFSKKFRANSGEIISFDGINIGDKDFNALLTRIKSLSPQAIFFGGVYTEGGLISRQAKGLGLNAPLVGGDALKSPEYIDIGASATEGDFVTMIGLPPEKLPRANEFIEKYRKSYPQAKIQPYDAYTYDTVMIIIDAIQNAGRDKAKIIEYIAKIQYSGATGTISFDEKGDTKNKAITMYRIKDATFHPLP